MLDPSWDKLVLVFVKNSLVFEKFWPKISSEIMIFGSKLSSLKTILTRNWIENYEFIANPSFTRTQRSWILIDWKGYPRQKSSIIKYVNSLSHEKC